MLGWASKVVTSAPKEASLSGGGDGKAAVANNNPLFGAIAKTPAVDDVAVHDSVLVDVHHYPPGFAVPRPNVTSFAIDDRAWGLVPIGRNTVTISDTDLQFHRMESPFNIQCCAGRAGENTHWSSIKLLRHSRGARSAARLAQIVGLCALAGVAMFYGADAKMTKQEKEGAAIGVSVGLFLPLFALWFFDRKAFFGYSTSCPEGSAITAFISREGIAVSQFKLEQALEAAWAAWGRFRGFKPGKGGEFQPLKAREHPLASVKSEFVLRSANGTPAGGDYLALVDNQAVVLQRTRGFMNWDIFSSSVWESFWADDVQFVHYSVGGRTQRGFAGAIVVAAAVALGIAFGNYTEKQREAGEATPPAAGAGGAVLLVLLIRWFFSAQTHVQFGLTEAEAPVVRVPQLSSLEVYNAVTRALFKRDVDLSTVLTPGGSKICGKDVTGNCVELTITPDVTEIKTFIGAESACEKFVCRLCTDLSVYRCRTRDIMFVYASTASIVNAIVRAFATAILGIAVTVLSVPQIHKTASAREEAQQMGVGVSLGMAVLVVVQAVLTRKSVVCLGSPSSKPLPVAARVLDALGFLPAEVKFTYRVEFVSLLYSPEQTLDLVSAALRAAKAKSRPLDASPVPSMTGLPGLPANPVLPSPAGIGMAKQEQYAGAYYPTPAAVSGSGVSYISSSSAGSVPITVHQPAAAVTVQPGGEDPDADKAAAASSAGFPSVNMGGMLSSGLGMMSTLAASAQQGLASAKQGMATAAGAVASAAAKAAPPRGESKEQAAQKKAKADFDAGELPPGWNWEQVEGSEEIYFIRPDESTTWDDPREDWDTFWKEYL